MLHRVATSVLSVCIDSTGDQARIAQEQTLQELVRDRQSTAFGRSHRFGDIESVEQFQRHVPLVASEAGLAVARAHAACDSKAPLTQRTRDALFRKFGCSLRSTAQTGVWLDLWDSVRRETQATHAGKPRPFFECLDAVIHKYHAEPVEVLIGPMHWLTGVLARIEYLRAQSKARKSRLSDDFWPELSLVIGSISGTSAFRVLVESRLAERRTHPRLVSAYRTPNGALVGLEAEPGAETYVLLPDAGVFFEFAESQSRARLVRRTLWEVKYDTVYELCVSTRAGLLGHRTGQQVQFVPAPTRRSAPTDAVSVAQVALRESSAPCAPLRATFPRYGGWSKAGCIQC